MKFTGENVSIPEGKSEKEIFQNFVKVGFIDADAVRQFDGYMKLKSGGFMPLVIELLSEKPPFYKISVSHYGEQNGDLMADPDMEIMIDTELKQAIPVTFRNDYLGLYQAVYDERGAKNVSLYNDLVEFLLIWSQNMVDQGFACGKGCDSNG